MQDFIDQAAKNKVQLFETGRCQFCGADYQRGIFECMENYNKGLQLLNFQQPEYHQSRFLSVDAHALQHPEIHGRWSNHFHLTRLHLIVKHQMIWDYKISPLLSDYLNVYKGSRLTEFLTIPKPLERGTMTAKDVSSATTANECVEQARKWAVEVYLSWSENNLIISEIAVGFLNKARLVN